MTRITKTLTAIAAAATLAVVAVAAPQPAEARGGRIAAGIIGGLAAGAILGGIASQNGYYGPGYGPGYYGYAAAPVYYGPRCYWSRQRVWDGWGWQLRRVRVCNLSARQPESKLGKPGFGNVSGLFQGSLNLRHQIFDILGLPLSIEPGQALN
jgi:hypothetical protein